MSSMEKLLSSVEFPAATELLPLSLGKDDEKKDAEGGEQSEHPVKLASSAAVVKVPESDAKIHETNASTVSTIVKDTNAAQNMAEVHEKIPDVPEVKVELKPVSTNSIELHLPRPESDKPAVDIEDPIVPTTKLILLCVCLSIGLFLSLLDTSIVSTALYTIGDEFNDLSSVNWVALAYTLSYVGFAVVFARMGDIAGRRWTYIAASIIFIAFSIGCGFAQSMTQLIACRAIQGIGGAGVYSLSMVIFPEISPPKMKKFIGAIAGLVVAMSGICGPVFGGIITQYASWRWIFFINAPIGLVPLFVFYFAWPKPDQMHHAKLRPLREFDPVSAILLIAASVLVVFAIQQAGISGAWGSVVFINLMIFGCFCWALLFGWELIVATLWPNSKATVFPLRLAKKRVYMFAVLCTFLIGFPYFVIIYNLPLRLQIVSQSSPLKASISLVPMLGSAAFGSMFGGAVNGKKNRCFETFLIASSFMALGTGLLSTLSNTLSIEAKTYGFQVFVGLGFGLTVATVSMLAATESELRDHAVAQGIVAQSRVFGGSLGIAASTAIIGATQRRDLAGIVTEAQLASLEVSALTFTADQLHAVSQAYSDSFNQSMRVCAIISAVCVLAAFGTFQRNPVDLAERRKQQLEQDNSGAPTEEKSPL